MNQDNTQIIAALTEYMNAFSVWENGIHERLKAAAELEQEGEEARLVMGEYEKLLKKYCTGSLISDPKRRKVDLHYRRPSPYGFTEVGEVDNKAEGAIIICYDRRKKEYGEWYRYYLVKSDAGWLVDRREYVPGDRTPAITITI